MACEIIWTAEADNDFNNIVTYLKAEWSLEVAQRFVNRIYKKLERLAAQPSLGRSTSKSKTYMYKLDRKNVVFFLLENNFMVLLSFYPYKKDITKSRYF